MGDSQQEIFDDEIDVEPYEDAPDFDQSQDVDSLQEDADA